MSITEIFRQMGEPYICDAEHRLPDEICGRSPDEVAVQVLAAIGEMTGKEEE